MNEYQDCLRCGLPESHPRHHPEQNPPEGWHPFRGQDYLDGIEDALLFAREKNQPHQWRDRGIIIDTNPPFAEKNCTVCGAINWGGKEDGVCFGNRAAEQALIAAHNRRAFRRMGERARAGESQ